MSHSSTGRNQHEDMVLKTRFSQSTPLMPFSWQPYSIPPETHTKWRTGDGVQTASETSKLCPLSEPAVPGRGGNCRGRGGFTKVLNGWCYPYSKRHIASFRSLLRSETNEQLQTLCLSAVCHLQGSAGWAPQRCCYCCVM